MQNRRKPAAIALAGVVLMILAGCTTLFSCLEDSTDTSLVSNQTEGQSFSTMSLRERIAFRGARDSSYYDSVSSEVRAESQPYVLTSQDGRQVVIFTLEADCSDVINDGFKVYPYVMFVFDSTSREPAAVFKATPDIDTGTLSIESLIDQTASTEPMSESVLAELRAARLASASPPDSRPKDYLCNPDCYSYQLWYCVETVPGYMDWDEYADCLNWCSRLDCLVWCLGFAWHPEYCAEWDYTIIEPCPECG